MDDQKNSAQQPSTIESRSQVTPNRTLASTWGSFAIVVLVVIVIIAIGLLSHYVTHHSNASQSTTQSLSGTATLEENLAHLRAMVEAEKAKYPQLKKETPAPVKPESLSKAMLARLNAPTSVMMKENDSFPQPHKTKEPREENSNTLVGHDANSRFVNAENAIGIIEASRIPHPEFVVAAGEIIPAVLESAISSDLPGMVRAVISRDVYSLQGKRLLIPKGARLVGQYSSGIVQGQQRILVVWERVQLSNGVVIAISSPSTDPLGRTGAAADDINTHFMEKFATSALLSVMGAFSANAGVSYQDQYNSSSAYRTSVADSFQSASNQALQQNITIRPTLSLNQGTAINVFVAHDLSFSQVMGGRRRG